MVFLCFSGCFQSGNIESKDLLYDEVTQSENFQAFFKDFLVRGELLNQRNPLKTIDSLPTEAQEKVVEAHVEFALETSELFQKIADFHQTEAHQSSDPKDALAEIRNFVALQDAPPAVKEQVMALINHDAQSDLKNLTENVLNEFPDLTEVKLLEFVYLYQGGER